jgi:nucleotide-binding universal stress UspA family protein
VAKNAGHGRAHRAGFRPHLGYVAAIVLFAAVFASLVLSAFHAPKPHDLSVGIVAPAPVTRQVEGALDAAEPGGFDLRVYPSEAAARAAIAQGSVYGALIDSSGGPRLLVAQAAGTAPTQTLTTAFGAVAAHSGHSLVVTDVVPPLPEDSLALSPFFVILSVLFPSLAAGSASALVFRRAKAAWCVAAPVVAAIGIGAVAAAIADGVAGLGHYPAIAGIVALFALAVAAPTAALGRIKPPLMALMLLVGVVLGIPVSGGPSGLAPFVPSFLRVLHPALPLGLAANVVRSVVYFNGYGTTGPLWVLAAWAVLGLVALTLVTRWRQAQALRMGTVPAVATVSDGHADHTTVVPTPADAPAPFPLAGFVVGFDNSVPAQRALGQAARLAAAKHEVLHVVYADHVVIDSDLSGLAHAEMEEARDEEAIAVAQAAAEIATQAGVAYTFERSRSTAGDAILSAAHALAATHERSPVIVVGRSGHAAHHLLGSVPTHLLARSPFPVLAIP